MVAWSPAALRSLCQRAAERLQVELEALATDFPWPALGEYLVLDGESGNYVTSVAMPDIRYVNHFGFLAGRYWLFHAYRGEARFRDMALGISLLHRRPPAPHSMISEGLNGQASVALGERLTGDPRLRELGLATCHDQVAHFHDRLEVFLRFREGTGRPGRDVASVYYPGKVGGDFMSSIDDSAAAGLLYWGAAFEPELAGYVLRAQRAMRAHGVIGADGRVENALIADGEGRVLRVVSLHATHHFTRGQAWAIQSGVAAYEASRAPDLLEDLQKMLGYYRQHVIQGGAWVPPYDSGAPRTEGLPRDTCAPAIVANAVLRLLRLEPSLAPELGPLVESTLTELVTHHLTPGGTLLHGCWGLFGGAAREQILPFGSYFLTEAVMRILMPEHPLWEPRG